MAAVVDWGDVVADPTVNNTPVPAPTPAPTPVAVPATAAPASAPVPAPTQWGDPVPDPTKDVSSKLPAPDDKHAPPHEEVAPYTEDQAEIDAGVGSDVPVIPYGNFSKHMVQGAEKAVVGVIGLPGDLAAMSQKNSEAAIKAGVDPDTGMPIPGMSVATDNTDKTPANPPAQVSTPEPSFMSSPYIMGKLKGTVFDPNKYPVETTEDKIGEGAGGLLANLPLLAVGGPEAKAGEEAVSAAPTLWTRFMNYLGSGAKGAVSGGAGAAVETPGDATERAQAGVEGAVLGGGVGVAAPAVVDTVMGVKNMLPSVTVEGMPKAVSPNAARAAGQTFADKLGPSGVDQVNTAATAPRTDNYSPTVGQVVPDNPKVVQMEQTARAADKGAFTAKADANTASEQAAISNVGGDGKKADVAPALQAGADQVTAQGNIDSEAARDQARQAADATNVTAPSAFKDVPAGGTAPPTTASEAYGADTRATLLTQKKALSDQADALKGQVNTDGNVVVPTQSVQSTVADTYNLNPSAKAPDANEAAIRDTIKGWGANVPLADVDTMRTRINSEIDQRIKDGATSTTPDVVRLQQVKRGLDQSTEDGAALAGQQPTVQTPPSGSGSGASPVTSQTTSSSPNPPLTPLNGSKRAPQDLASFIIQKGGVADPTGDIAAMGGDAIHHKTAGRLINPNGISPDYMREAAEEAGYLRPNSTINDLYDAIGEQVSGRPVYTQSEQAEGVLAKQNARQQALQEHHYSQAREDVGQVEDDTGVKLNENVADAAAKMVVGHGLSPEEAHESVVRDREDQVLQHNAEHNAIGAPGMPLAQQMALPDISQSGSKMPPNPRYFTTDEVAARAQLRDINTQLASNYGHGVVGDVLAYGDHASGAKDLVAPDMSRTKGGFSTQDADVMGKIWDGSRNENANVQQFIKAGGDIQKLTSYAADDLRSSGAVDPITGDVDPAKYAAWRQTHRAGLNSAPELKAAFDGLDAAQKTVQSVAEKNAANLKQYNSDVVKTFIGQNADAAVKKMFENGNSANNTSEILGKIGKNAEGLAGLKRAVGDYVGDVYKPLSQTGSTIADAGRAKAFNDFLTQHADALTQLYGNDGLSDLRLVGKQMADRSANANSALRAAPPKASTDVHGHPVSSGGLIMAELGLHAGEELVDKVLPVGARELAGGAVLGVKAINALRRGGIQTQGQLLNLMALNPTTVGRQMLQHMQRGQPLPPQLSGRLAATIGAVTAAGQTNQNQAAVR